MSYHRDVFAFPGRVGDPYSQGCNRLIRDSKVALLQNAQDFVEKWLDGNLVHRKSKKTKAYKVNFSPTCAKRNSVL